MEDSSQRNILIDFLKVIGLLLIILAHTIENPIVLQIRNFDVPLLVILSGILSVKSFKKEKNILTYYKKRIFRLLIPTYIFIIIYFGVLKILKIIAGDFQYKIDINSVINSLLLIGGISYIWIIRVYLLTAFLTPVLIIAKEKLNNRIYFMCIIIIYALYEILYRYVGDVNYFFQYILYYIIPYSTILSIGITIGKKENQNIERFLCFGAFGIFVAVAILEIFRTGHFVYTNEFKYPPRIYYISYSIFASMAVMLISQKINFNAMRKKTKNIIIFISQHSLWIYFWHIIYISIFSWTKLSINCILKYILVISMSIITVITQVKLISKIEEKKKLKLLKYLKY